SCWRGLHCRGNEDISRKLISPLRNQLQYLHCNRIVLGNNYFLKGYFFVAICLLFFLLSLIIKYGVK
ncbi:MAG: hypothetical protein ABSC11_12050, partial [Smithella sp.]